MLQPQTVAERGTLATWFLFKSQGYKKGNMAGSQLTKAPEAGYMIGLFLHRDLERPYVEL